MKQFILASACIMALATGGAFAQTQPAPGASGQGDVGPSSREGIEQRAVVRPHRCGCARVTELDAHVLGCRRKWHVRHLRHYFRCVDHHLVRCGRGHQGGSIHGWRPELEGSEASCACASEGAYPVYF